MSVAIGKGDPVEVIVNDHGGNQRQQGDRQKQECVGFQRNILLVKVRGMLAMMIKDINQNASRDADEHENRNSQNAV